jgi:hypothetical protein
MMNQEKIFVIYSSKYGSPEEKDTTKSQYKRCDCPSTRIRVDGPVSDPSLDQTQVAESSGALSGMWVIPEHSKLYFNDTSSFSLPASIRLC